MAAPPLHAAPAQAPTRSCEHPNAQLCELAVELLAALPGNEFTPDEAWGRLVRTRAGGRCCMVKELPDSSQAASVAANLFYFGRDADGYTMVTARRPIASWPVARNSKKLLPVRLARWMLQAPADTVVRHVCDTPACVAYNHLVPGTQADNLGDAIARQRRARNEPSASRGTPRLAAAKGGASTSAAATPATREPREHDPPRVSRDQDDIFCVTGFYSPSKKARKMHRCAPGGWRESEGELS